MQRILVLGAGFAGLWSAVAAARRLDELGVDADAVEVLVVNRTPWHSIRVRNYEADIDPALVPLADVLDPIGVKHIVANVTDVDVRERTVACTAGGASERLTYDRLVFALGSRLALPAIPGLEAHAFDVDTFEAARKLNEHIASLPSLPASAGQYSVLVVGAGLTGVEVATEMVGKLAASHLRASAHAPRPRVILADHCAWIGSDMGEGARRVIAEALRNLGVETRPSVSVASIDAEGATLATGERIEAATVVWCVGMQADPLTARFPVARDRLGRLPVDPNLKIKGMAAEFAAGDAAWLPIDGAHASVMSCQHARPMGRFAGYNAVGDLLRKPMLPLQIDWYVTCLDLGAFGAVYTEGWDRTVAAVGVEAKGIKETINRKRIYPPRSRNRREILEAAAPTVQTPPKGAAH
ncbi:MAG TPA: FAD-dependent oxidoreductase [Roseiarcus sp.]|jgi:NADH dehydrogenase|nr:FAD-dependent oxidoreductase [Roseiarcus sp.]